MPELSVVIPVYGCKDCLRSLHARLTDTLLSIGRSYELIFVDDRSIDGSWDLLKELAATDPTIRPIRLSRNFGQHAAITAGLASSRGRFTVVMDCDLEDPPEEIPRLLAKTEEGYDAVLCRRRERRQALSRRILGRLYRRTANALARTDIDLDYTNLSIISRKVTDAYLSVGDLDRQYLLIVLWLGFEHTTIEVDQADRNAGSSSYSFRRLVRVAIEGIVFQTTNLLTLVICCGFLIAAGGVFAAGALVIYSYIVYAPPPGWASLAVMTTVLSGVIVLSTGITGLYVGKIFNQVKGRPLYVIDADAVPDGGSESNPNRHSALASTGGSPARSEPTSSEQLGSPGD